MSRTLPPVDYLLVGHVTCDRLPDGREVTGGTASYAALTAVALGRSVGVVTSAGPGFVPPAAAGPLCWSIEPAEVTTTFENRYDAGQRQQFLHAVARPLVPAILPAAWQAVPLVHLGPVAGECDPAWITAFAGRAFIGLTPQGWMRRVDSGGRVFPTRWDEADRWLPQASAVVVSLEDVAGDWALAQAMAARAALLVVTRGRAGSTLFVGGVPQEIPAPAVTEVDPTGAGDIFAAALFIALAGAASPPAAVQFATCLASRSVTRVGLEGVPLPVEGQACGGWLDPARSAERLELQKR